MSQCARKGCQNEILEAVKLSPLGNLVFCSEECAQIFKRSREYDDTFWDIGLLRFLHPNGGER